MHCEQLASEPLSAAPVTLSKWSAVRMSKNFSTHTHCSPEVELSASVVDEGGHGSHESTSDILSLGLYVPRTHAFNAPERHQKPGGQSVQAFSLVSSASAP